ncbi:F-box/LRR-repeat protein 2-like [Galendromus occidentalis]|uniref:F-box/LRR-repeat protein 2-like n=1 Tax=Galendromus occidentalis TaxID=34638 RepID=A0AAJ6QU50_9ACAR|nr:F-box/LRR-repeat protein 2-like [Galendromus occidentalis]
MMDTLPAELLEPVLLSLGPLERLNFAQTSRQIAELVSQSICLRDVLVEIRKSNADEAEEVLMKSRRNCRKLRMFEVEVARFGESFWSKLGQNLRTLELLNCDGTADDLFKILRHCTELRYLVMNGFGPEAGVPTASKLAPPFHLQHISLDADLPIETLERLFELTPSLTSLSFCYLETSGLEYEKRLAFFLNLELNLERLSITMAALRDNFVVKLLRKHARSLAVLEMTCCADLTHKAFEAISGCRKLRHLTLRGSVALSEEHLLKIFINCPELETFPLPNFGLISDAFLTRISKVEKVSDLCLHNYEAFTSNSLAILSRMKNLRRLKLPPFDDDGGSYEILSTLWQLRSLDLGVHKGPSRESFNMLTQNLLELVELAINCKDLVDTDGLKFNQLKKLRCLKILRGPNFTDRAFLRGLGSKSLRELYIRDCPLTSFGLVSITEHHTRLESLSIDRCDNLTERAVANALRHVPGLRKLAIANCERITEESLSALALEKLCPRLRSELNQCSPLCQQR